MPWTFKSKDFVDYYCKEEGDLEVRITKMIDFNKIAVFEGDKLIESKRMGKTTQLEKLFEAGNKMLIEVKMAVGQ